MMMAPACPRPCAIKCCSEECALTKPPPVRDWDWQSFAILPNFTRGRSRWTTHLWAVCARASVYPAERVVWRDSKDQFWTNLAYATRGRSDGGIVKTRGLVRHDELVRSVAGRGRSCRSDQEPGPLIRSV